MQPAPEELFRSFLEFVTTDQGARARLREALRDEALERLVGELAAFRTAAETRFLRIEQALEALAEAQRRTEKRLEALAEAERRTEERLEALAEAERRTEERLEALAEAQEGLTEQFGRLTADIGVTAEIEAAEILTEVLEQRRYLLLGEPESVLVDGEVDVAAGVRDPEGRQLTVLVEVKNRLYPQDLLRWADRVASKGFRARLAASGLPAPYLVYAFGRRVFRGVKDLAAERGIGLLTPRGEQVPPQLLEA